MSALELNQRKVSKVRGMTHLGTLNIYCTTFKTLPGEQKFQAGYFFNIPRSLDAYSKLQRPQDFFWFLLTENIQMVDCGQGPEADSSCPGCWTCPARTQSLFLGETGLRLQTAFDFILGMYDNIATTYPDISIVILCFISVRLIKCQSCRLQCIRLIFVLMNK